MTVMDTQTPDVYPTRTSSHPRRIARTHPTVWPVRSGPITPADLARHARDGSHIVPRLLDRVEVQRYWDELGRLCTDPRVLADERTVVEKRSREVRSIFEVHQLTLEPQAGAGVHEVRPAHPPLPDRALTEALVEAREGVFGGRERARKGVPGQRIRDGVSHCAARGGSA